MKVIQTRTLLFILVLLSATFACSDKKENTTPATAEIPAALVTTYTGSLSYTQQDGTVKTNDDSGKAILTKSGSTYTLSFSDGVPALSGLKFSSANGAYTTTSTDGSVTGISIHDPGMDISVSRSSNTWAFSGTK